MKTLMAMTSMWPPPPIVTSSLPTVRWPLRDESQASMTPMYYLNMQEMHDLRVKSASASRVTNSNDNNEWMDNVPRTISALIDIKKEYTQKQYDYTILSLSLLLLGHNYTDEAHNLVTPYSWPDEIHTSFGPVRYTSSDPGVVSYASYIHSLVHRKEGWNVGEFGMVGYSNADFWTNAWLRPVTMAGNNQQLKNAWREPLMDIRKAVEHLAQKNNAGREWCQRNLPELQIQDIDDNDEVVIAWEPRAMHRLCAQVIKEDNNAELTEFAEQAGEAELRVLIHHCLQNAGYSLSDLNAEKGDLTCNNYSKGGIDYRNNIQSDEIAIDKIDKEMALFAANKISSAHASAFLSDGIVILRNVMSQQQQHLTGDEKDIAASSIAAGIATCLLDSPACRETISSDIKSINTLASIEHMVGILLPVNEESAIAHSSILSSLYGKGPLCPGDALVVAGDMILPLMNNGCHGLKLYQACSSEDDKATFVNRLYGGRGETPTSVVQWSKGTAHYSSL